MEEKKVKLTKVEFYILHTSIEQKCNDLLRKEGKDGLWPKSENYYYGHGDGKQADEYMEETLCSIKHVILKYYGDIIKKSRLGFLNESDDFGIKFDGRYLNNLKNEYNLLKEGEELIIQRKYFEAFLMLLECTDKEEMIIKYSKDNEASMPFDPPNYIIPTENSRIPKEKAPSLNTHIQDDKPKTKLTHQDKITKRLDKFESTYWYYYAYNSKTRKKDPTRIIRLIFKVGKKNKKGDFPVELIKAQKPFKDFSGILVREDSNDKIVIFRLKTKDGQAKYKQLMFHIDPGGGKNLYLGQYQSYDDTHTVMSGTVIIQKIENHENMRADDFVVGTNKINAEIDPHIQEYLKHKNLNFIKTKTGISSLYDLKNWLDDKIEERIKKNPVKIYDLFIAAPKTAIKEDETYYENLKVEIEDMLKSPLWSEMGIKNLYWGPLTYSDHQDDSFILKRERLAFKKSKAFLLVFMENKPIATSAYTEVGWAIESGKPTFIIYKKRDCLPRLLQVAWVLDNVVMPDSPIPVKEIPRWISANEYYKMIE